MSRIVYLHGFASGPSSRKSGSGLKAGCLEHLRRCVVVLAGTVGWMLVSGSGRLGTVSISSSNFGETHNIAHLLFRDFLLPFEITSVLNLIAIMGAVVLGKREN